ncbi:AraC family transcriptional regulator [Ruminococcaceae bacterium OttesenSCG-928-L11]|nr:AraC family transcriptional regulator [Ruminococcaceae bacterium OttesenSCG-928-L11]
MQLLHVQVDQYLREQISHGKQGFSLATTPYNQMVDHMVNCHWHHEFEFGLLLSGGLDFRVNQIHFQLQKGDCMFITSNALHMAKQSPHSADTELLVAHLSPTLFSPNADGPVYRKYIAPLLGPSVQGFPIHRDSSAGRDIATVLWELHQMNPDDFGYELNCIGLLSRLLRSTLLYVDEGRRDVLVQSGSRDLENTAKDILTFIHTHYAEDILVADLARHVHLSRSECFKCFRQYTNKTPIEYINEYRLAQAAKQLTNTTRSVAEISMACGIGSSSYFGKLFKEKHGISPTEYRNRASRNAETGEDSPRYFPNADK